MALILRWAQFDAEMFWLVSRTMEMDWFASGAGGMVSVLLGQVPVWSEEPRCRHL